MRRKIGSGQSSSRFGMTIGNERGQMTQVLETVGAGEGKRTLVISLEGCCSTIELHPRTRSLHASPSSAKLARSLAIGWLASCSAERATAGGGGRTRTYEG